jgi:hypothetical protein
MEKIPSRFRIFRRITWMLGITSLKIGELFVVALVMKHLVIGMPFRVIGESHAIVKSAE